MKEFLESATFNRLIKTLGILLIALFIFWAGTVVGYKKASFSYHWSDNYARNFGGPGSPFIDSDDSPVNPNGAFGTVVAIKLPTIVIKGPKEAEKIVDMNPDVFVRRLHDNASSTDLHIGDTVVVIGSPDEFGHVHASFIRILPNPTPPMYASSSIPINNK